MQTYLDFANHQGRIPQVGLGVFQASPAEAYQAVLYALEAGYRHIDTAKIYGNEEGVGRALKESGVPREEIFLTTKLWNEDVRRHRTREALLESLKRLGTSYVDLYLIHWPAEGYCEAWSEMEKLYQEGLIRHIGLSNFHKHHIEDIYRIMKVKPEADQIESNPYFQNQELIDYLHEQDIVPQVWSPLGGGRGVQLKDPEIAKLAAARGKTPAQIIIRWQLQRGVVVLPKSVHQERIISNFAVFDFELSEEEMRRMNALERHTRTGSDPDHFNF